MNSRTEHDPDKSSKKPKHNAWRAYQAFKNLSEIQINKENQENETEVEELKKNCWKLREKVADTENPFLEREDFKEIEERLGE